MLVYSLVTGTGGESPLAFVLALWRGRWHLLRLWWRGRAPSHIPARAAQAASVYAPRASSELAVGAYRFARRTATALIAALRRRRPDLRLLTASTGLKPAPSCCTRAIDRSGCHSTRLGGAPLPQRSSASTRCADGNRGLAQPAAIAGRRRTRCSSARLSARSAPGAKLCSADPASGGGLRRCWHRAGRHGNAARPVRRCAGVRQPEVRHGARSGTGGARRAWRGSAGAAVAPRRRRACC